MRISYWSSDVCSSDLVAADGGDCLGFAFRARKHAANPSPAALRLEHAAGAWHVRKCRGGNMPACAFPRSAFAGAAEAASFDSLPCEGRGGLGRGAVGHRLEPWAPPPSLSLPSQGEGPRQELAAGAAPARAAPLKSAPTTTATIEGLHLTRHTLALHPPPAPGARPRPPP